MNQCQYKNLDGLLNELGIKNAPESWYINWEKAMSKFPGDQIEFLNDAYIREANITFKLQHEKLETFCKASTVIRESPALCHLTWLWYYTIFFGSSEAHKIDFSKWPVPDHIMGNLTDMFHAVILAAGLPLLREFYESRGIPYNIFIETLSDMEICMDEYYAEYGVFGIGVFRMGWLLNHFTGRLYRLGRLQFVYKEYDGSIRIFRNVNNGEIKALCEVGIEFRSDGKINGANSIFDDKFAWSSKYSEEDGYFCGNFVSPCGYPFKEPVKLCKNEWQPLLSKGDGLMNVHIPRGSALSYEACHEAYDNANKIFPTYFPEIKYKGFTCNSWMLSPELRLLLPENSNIIKFQKDYYLYPDIGDDSIFEYVFGEKPEDLSSLPEKTSLQRLVKKHLMEGNHINSAPGVFLLSCWGKKLEC